jgi:hypothetical protein
MITLPTCELAPEIDRCPCCGMLVCDRHPATGARERRNVQAMAVFGDAGWRLGWKCLACERSWWHGEFSEVKE